MHNHEDQFRQLANSIPQLAWMADANGLIYWYNDRWFAFSGTTLTEMEGWGWQKIHHPDHVERVTEKYKAAISGGSDWEDTFPIRGANGEHRWFLSRAFPIRDTKGNVLRWFGTNTDITDRLEVEQSLRTSEAFTRSILESSPDCIKILDLEGRLISMNDSGRQLMEIDDASVCFSNLWPSMWPEDYSDTINNALEKARAGEKASFEGFCPTAKGTPKWWEVLVTPIFSNQDKGTVERILCISRDISARKKIELELQSTLQEVTDAHASALLASQKKDEFLANMSHELRTPMNAIIGIGHILSKTSPLSDKQATCIRTLQSSSESLLALINDLLDLAKIESESIELENISFNLQKTVENVVAMTRMLATDKKISLAADFDQTLDETYIGDPHRIKQIITNLISNAIKFTERGGVKVSVRKVSELAGFTRVALHFSDTGIGIAEDKLHTIFNKFSQGDTSVSRKFGGTGLGLAISKNLAELMGGNIRVSSCEDVGSEFVLELPLARSDFAAKGGKSLGISKLLFGLKAKKEEFTENDNEPPMVLIVEDYKPNLLVACSYMDILGLRHETASNGQEAYDKFCAGEYDVVLMDVQMPGMDGLTATRLIRQWEAKHHREPVAIIGITAYALTGDREKCIEAGMNDYLTKPYSPDMVKSKIQHALSSAAPIRKVAAG